MSGESGAEKVVRRRSKRLRKEGLPASPPPLLLDTSESENEDRSMAVKEKPKEKSGNSERKKQNSGNSLSPVSSDVSLLLTKSDIAESDNEIKEDKTDVDDILEKSSDSISSPMVNCDPLADQETVSADMCSVEAKLDANFIDDALSISHNALKTDDITSDSDFPADLLDSAVSSCKPHKTENLIDTEPSFPSADSCESMLSSIGLPVSTPDPVVDGIQPLPSNMINKQPSTVDAQYMQQQSQIFVFSTALANKSAESVIQGNFPSIIAYHCSQPKTKKYLEKHPLKVNQFNRQNPAQWLNNLAQMKQKTVSGSNNKGAGRGFRNSPFSGPDVINSGSAPPSPGMGMNPRMPMWNQGNLGPMNNGNPQGQMVQSMCHNSANNMMPGPMGIGPAQNNIGSGAMTGYMGATSVPLGQGSGPVKCQSQPSPVDMMTDSPNSNLLSTSMLSVLSDFTDDSLPLSPHNNSLTGVKVPDENLTPQQRQHRVEQLAMLRKMQEMLFPENTQSPSHHSVTQDLQQSITPTPTGVDDLVSSISNSDANDMSNMHRSVSNAGHSDCWKNQFSFFDEKKKKSDSTNSRSNSRSQGPPPPYHQTRCASVPISVSSPNPGSPGNTTSNLSLPSPRTCSALNSPASRQAPGPSPTAQMNNSVDSPGQSHNRSLNMSNPGTPASSTHLSPNSKQKDHKLAANDYSPVTSDGIFCRSLQSLAQQQQQKQQQSSLPLHSSNSSCKEPNLMPVPSPQHIQYLNAFEGQELTIQKQPNTSLKETTNIVSPSLPTAALDSVIPEMSGSKISVSTPSTPLSGSSLDMGSGRYPGTPVDFPTHSPNADVKNFPQMRIAQNAQQLKQEFRYSCTSPQLISEQQRYHQSNVGGFMQQSGKNGVNFMDIKEDKLACSMGGGENKDCSGGSFSRMATDNIPLNPSMNPSGKQSQFDPISSLAQMSQQLTNNVPGSPVNQSGGIMHSGMVPYANSPGQIPNNMHMMHMNEMNMCGNPQTDSPMQDNSRMVYGSPMPPGMNMNMVAGGVNNRMIPCSNSGESVSPKSAMPQNQYPMMGPNSQRMLPRAQGQGPHPNTYNGANIQVKPNAPNTIQYLPNRPQSAAVGPRGPPSLEFLQRYSSPMPPTMDNKMPPSHNMNYFSNNYPGANMDMMGGMNCGMPPNNPMIRPGMRGPNNMMRMPAMNMGYGGAEQMFPPNPNTNMSNSNCHMYMPNSSPKVPQMNMGGVAVAPDATQPLPPSIGQSSNFKNSPFIGPTTADPNYAQQFHNFQQQLYATNTRSQMTAQSMNAANQQYFVPK